MPEDDRGPRYQPEFSPGERLARLEATFDARAAQDEAIVELFDEKIAGLRKELSAVNDARKEAVAKAEAATDRRLELIGAQIEADRLSENARLQALERGEAGGEAERRYKAGQVAWVAALAALVIAVLTVIVVVHP